MSPPALEQLFTLPFALHLAPLPTLEYAVESKDDGAARAARRRRRREQRELRKARASAAGRSPSDLSALDHEAKPSAVSGAVSADSSEESSDDSDDSESDGVRRPRLDGRNESASSSFDLAGGASRLRPVLTQYAPHSLDTINLLLEQTDLFSSIEALSKAIRMLDRASIVAWKDGQPSGAGDNAHATRRASGSSPLRGPLEEMDPGQEGLVKDVTFKRLRDFFDTRFNVTHDGERIDPDRPLYARIDATDYANSQSRQSASQGLSPKTEQGAESAFDAPLAALRRTLSSARSQSNSSSSGIADAASALSPRNTSPERKSGSSTLASLGEAFGLRRGSSTRPSEGSTQGAGVSRSGSLKGSITKIGGRRNRVPRAHSPDRVASFKHAQEQPRPVRVRSAGTQSKDVHFGVRLDLHNAGLGPVPAMTERLAFMHSQKAHRRLSHASQLSRPRSASVTSTDASTLFSGRGTSAFSGGIDLRSVISPSSILSTSSSSGGHAEHGAAALAASRSRSPQKPSIVTSGPSFNHLADSESRQASPAVSEPRSRLGSTDTGEHRPSFLKRVLDLGFKSRGRSASGMSSGSAADSQASNSNSAGVSVSSFAAFGDPNPFDPSRAAPAPPDTAVETLLSPGTVTQEPFFAPAPRSRHNAGSFGSSSMRMNMRPTQDGSHLRAVQEDGVFDDNSDVFSNSDTADLPDEHPWAEEEFFWQDGENFVSTLRQAASAALAITEAAGSALATPDATGGRDTLKVPTTPSSVRSRESGLLSPAGSVEQERMLAQARARVRLAQLVGPHCWLAGSYDPMPVAVACALGHALGWEGLMSLIYGPESAGASSGDFVPLGRAAELNEQHQAGSADVLAWRSSVAASAHASPEGSPAQHASDDAAALEKDLERLDVDTKEEGLGVWLKKLRARIQGEDPDQDAPNQPAPQSVASERSHRTWQDWLELFKSISAWAESFEETRVRAGLAGELGNEHEHKAWQAAADEGANAYFDPHLLADITNRENLFRRRHGIPEGLPQGPDGEELESYRWSRQNLDNRHFSTPLTRMCQSMEHLLVQLSTEDWPHRSAWELDYLEMCVFKSPIVAHRFPPPGYRAVSDEQTFQPSADERERANLCPMPSRAGAWNSALWRRWLSHVREGQVLAPAVAWQAWWTLIAILNGADRSGRAYALQVKSYEEPFSDLTDPHSVYL